MILMSPLFSREAMRFLVKDNPLVTGSWKPLIRNRFKDIPPIPPRAGSKKRVLTYQPRTDSGLMSKKIRDRPILAAGP